MLVSRLFERIITVGQLRVLDAGGAFHTFDGSPGASVTIRLRDPALHWKLFVRPRLYLGEAFMEGTLTVEEGTLYDLIDLLAINLEAVPEGLLARFLNGSFDPLRRVHQFNPLSRARQNAAHHYDLSDQLYELFLDQDRQYSCAYFRDGTDDLDTAQLGKKQHIAAKLLIRPGQKVLDIGSGWGGLALYLAGECGADVTGLTLSVEQHNVATRRAAAAGLSDRVRFYLRDYREERLHYAETLRAWRGRFERNRDRLRRIYDERFCRMWEMYLICSEIAFRRQDHMVFQMQLSKAVDTVPLTRDYILDWEREHSAASDRAA